MNDSDAAAQERAATNEESDQNDCECDDLPDGTPCFSCYADDNAEFTESTADGGPLQLGDQVSIPTVGLGEIAMFHPDGVVIEAYEVRREYTVPAAVALDWRRGTVPRHCLD